MLASFVNYFTLCCPFTLSDTDVDGLNPCACLNEMRGAVTNRNIWQVGDENWLKHLNQNKHDWNFNWLQRGSLNLFINWSKVKLYHLNYLTCLCSGCVLSGLLKKMPGDVRLFLFYNTMDEVMGGRPLANVADHGINMGFEDESCEEWDLSVCVIYYNKCDISIIIKKRNHQFPLACPFFGLQDCISWLSYVLNTQMVWGTCFQALACQIRGSHKATPSWENIVIRVK